MKKIQENKEIYSSKGEFLHHKATVQQSQMIDLMKHAVVKKITTSCGLDGFKLSCIRHP